MSVVSRIGIRDLKNRCQFLLRSSTLGKDLSSLSKTSDTSKELHNHENVNDGQGENKINKRAELPSSSHPSDYRFIYPEFLPGPEPKFRNSLREKLERKDMLARRLVIDIPEFYVGSILAVTHSDIHAPGKLNRFVGICILKIACGLRAMFVLRNVVDNQPVEVDYDLYDPCIKKIDCLKLQKRLDDNLLYLRDAALGYSTVPFDLEPEFVINRKEVPVNPIKIPLLPQPWVAKYELQNLKGITQDSIVINRNRTEKAKKAAKPWEKYDLMKIYRNTIPEEEQKEIYSELHLKLRDLEITRQKQKRARVFIRPKKTG